MASEGDHSRDDVRRDDASAANLRFLNWVRSDEFFSADECDEVVDLGLSHRQDLGRVDDGEIHDRRQAYVHRIAPSDLSQNLLRRLMSLAQEINEMHFGFDLHGITPPDYVEYHADFGHFDWHNDYAYLSADRVRKLTIIVQLSDPADYKGGSLEIFGSPPVVLPKERGAVLAFPTFVFHRVTPVTLGVRRSLVTWVSGPVLR